MSGVIPNQRFTSNKYAITSPGDTIHLPLNPELSSIFVDDYQDVSPVESVAQFGGRLTFVIPYAGHFIAEMDLVTTVAVLSNSGSAGMFWQPFAGQALINRATMFVGTQKVDEYTGAFTVLQDLVTKPKQEWCNISTLSTFDPIMLNQAAAGYTFYTPLQFHNHGTRNDAIPLTLLNGTGNDLRIQIDLETLNNLVMTEYASATTTTCASIVPSLRVHYSNVSNMELGKIPRALRFSKKYVTEYLNIPWTTGAPIRLPFTGVVFELYVAVRDAYDTVTYASSLSTTFVVPRMKFRRLKSIGLRVDNTDVFKSDIGAQYFQRVLKTRFHPRSQELLGYTAGPSGSATAAYGGYDPASTNDAYGIPYIYTLPLGTDLDDKNKLHGGLDFGAYKTVELTLTHYAAASGTPWYSNGTAKPVVDIYAVYHNEVIYENGGARRKIN